MGEGVNGNEYPFDKEVGPDDFDKIVVVSYGAQSALNGGGIRYNNAAFPIPDEALDMEDIGLMKFSFFQYIHKVLVQQEKGASVMIISMIPMVK